MSRQRPITDAKDVDQMITPGVLNLIIAEDHIAGSNIQIASIDSWCGTLAIGDINNKNPLEWLCYLEPNNEIKQEETVNTVTSEFTEDFGDQNDKQEEGMTEVKESEVVMEEGEPDLSEESEEHRQIRHEIFGSSKEEDDEEVRRIVKQDEPPKATQNLEERRKGLEVKKRNLRKKKRN
eukprot:CAMPEP_0174271128 /NCGR_PEP_ID=MMETSP0439-20130205/46860_1 /TAXON_ID=0 /ORGANISM="Stereomyxa ramosa, Strain Chinc5" /LENGTH=178 /DNA_ID=CAMNT_0015360931 /DNA_START=1916 /DNA_END=2451 /DNA_ORIENTATION=+